MTLREVTTKMEYRNIRGTDLNVSLVGIGCNNFGMRADETKSFEVIYAALDAGINFFDTADIYGGRGRSEEILGKAITGRDRSTMIIATKFANPMSDDGTMKGASRDYIVRAVEASLTRLNTDYIDLYQQHVPDPKTPIDETLRALDDLVQSGKVRAIGHSNFTGWQIADADWTAASAGASRFVTAQNLYSLLDRRIEREVIPACQRFGLQILPYFPLASGMLTGKYTRGEAPKPGTRLALFGDRGKKALSDDNFDKVEALTEYANNRGHSILELAMSWLAAQSFIPSIIAGATSAAQVHANAASAHWVLTEEDLAAIDGLTR
ncbi:MAG: aldo/keto reductase [Pseudomonadales bacterium]